VKLELTPRTWLALVALGPAIFIAIQLLPLLRSLFLLALITALLALLINPLADRLERRGVSRGLTVGLTLGGVVVVLVGLLLLLLPVLFSSLERLASNFSGVGAIVQEQLQAVTGSVEVGAIGQRLIGQAGATISWAVDQLGALLGQIGALGFGLFVAAACIFALVAEKGTARALMRAFVPARHHARLASLTTAVSEGLSRWLVAQLLICLYYVITYSAAGLIVGIPFAVQIGLVSGLFEFIPYLGGIVGLVLSVLSAATVSPTAVLLILGIEAIIGAVCVYFVAPYAFARAVDVPPALILVGLFVGGLLGGFFAALLTVPLLAAGLVVYRQLRGAPAAPPETAPAVPKPAGD
jgi:predicted PurR-regulated permease PerM